MGRREVFSGSVAVGLLGILGNILQNHYASSNEALDVLSKITACGGFTPAAYITLEQLADMGYSCLNGLTSRVRNRLNRDAED